ncbi:flagellin N-terminal helical domain-containing protein [Lysinibacillus fusiformis]|uniref:flagellin N-terminal helical domain-containing protein n=1 Tax=Lysinibacillus fusiformis TaxID=28031 RepID=UPI0008830A80|nr:flagellin [Lysinibacillus fusiformis]MCG7433838.1 flagellin [Lysinibacillus fusiformis]SCX67564.1 flagellin [Lysinibacillus fusiformis]SDB52887.1 flagellin [Lysinibacillus fusiformis]SFI98729.1 flagellin [Lysinibacillus fusiformis]SFT25571.1 flagellin [Lysinibacillus fusiformis]
MRIQHNISALNTHRNLTFNNTQASKNLEKLSSGYKINRAGDDAAGLAISEKMRGQIRGLDMATKNSQDGISLIQTAEGALNETHAILQRMRELAVQSANDTNVSSDRGDLQKEINALSEEITRIANNTEFNTQKLLNGSFSAKKFHIGANKGQDISLTIATMTAAKLSVSKISISSQTAANNAIETINTALTTVSATRSDLGAVQNRLEHTINNLGATSENLTAAESRIRDTDMAKEMMGFTKNNILMQAAQSMLAQANQQPQGVLQLLQ